MIADINLNTKKSHLILVLLIILQTSSKSQGDLETTYARCCAIGANWARETQKCELFPAPVPGEPLEHQTICLTTASICCLRYYRENQCENAKQAAKEGLECISKASTEPGGEFYKDCCDGCKLGLISGSMAMGCAFKGFSFGFPWNGAYLECCIHASPPGTLKNITELSQGNTLNQNTASVSPNLDANDENFLFLNRVDGKINIPDSKNLCLLFPGQLCGHVCMPTPGSYVCQCRAGFSLSADGKTCIQETIKDRCEINNPCDHICKDTGMSVECDCRPGYQLSIDQQSCNDVNECEAGVHLCIPTDQVCYNQPGSYACVNADGSLTYPDLLWGQGHTVRPETINLRNPHLGITTPILGNQNFGIGGGHTLGNRNLGIQNPNFRHSSLGVQGYPGSINNPELISQGICPPGYNYNLQSRVCDDIDECVIALGICGQGVACENTIGSYTCTPLITGDCPSGFQFNMNHQSCLDINECTTGIHNCNPLEVCNNIQGGFTCKKGPNPPTCEAGYKFDSVTKICIDIDECSEGLHICQPDVEKCRNRIGSYECDINCQKGFIFTALPTPSCVDVNECQIGSHSCNPSTELCINTEGSFRCQSRNRKHNHVNILAEVTQATPLFQDCSTGFGFDMVNNLCVEISECKRELNNCTTPTHDCVNTVLGFLCTPKSKCSSGYFYNPETKLCFDVDECSEKLSNCLPGQICVNTEGSFDCRVECRNGFIYDPDDPSICVDVDECLDDPCLSNQRCKNFEGSFFCFPSVSNESSVNVSSLNAPSTTPAVETTTTLSTPKRIKPTKAPCPRGFKRKRRSSECKDINECREGLDNCLKSTEECINLKGSYTCRPKTCSRGYHRDTDTKDCKDIDECLSSPCGPTEDCINTPGSFICMVRPPCDRGFKRNEITRECQDIDECEDETPCDITTRCINTRGSYRCRSLDCTPGYQRNLKTGNCEDVNECETGEHSCKLTGEECVNSPGTYRCKALLPCPQGFKRDPANFRCVDVDECAEGLSDCNKYEQCINQYGRYKCTPKPNDCGRGFRFSSTVSRCEDIDECVEKLDNCNGGTRTCVNSVGSFRCVERNPVCDFGSYFNDQLQSCQELVSSNVRLNTTETTTITADSMEMNILDSRQNWPQNFTTNITICQPGFLFRYRQGCVDIDECTQGSHLCNESRERCVNLPGAYKCERLVTIATEAPSARVTFTTTMQKILPKTEANLPHCSHGYIYNALFRSCTDIDECEGDICDRDTENCINTQGSYICECKIGFTKEKRSGECIDVNECQQGLHSCEVLQRCDNTLGSFTCTRLSGCGTGYTLNHNTGKCEDDDECKLGRNDCRQLGPKWVCVNTKGSFRCEKKKCPPKQLLNSWGICVNITCTPGFKPHETSCVDIDECHEGTPPCKPNEHCFNHIGSFECRPKINCGRGYRLNDAGTQCTDIDECKENLDTCDGDQLCTNRPGGYVCQCPPGYRLDVNRQCQDINECQTAYSSFCGNTGECENTPGSYRCNCKEGFKKTADNHLCVDVDECSEIEGICEHNCINIWGSHYCTCNAGFKLNKDNRSCSDIDECEEIKGKGRLCLGICVNTPGTFKCSCPSGYQLDSDQRTCKDINECDTVSTCRDPNEICVNTRGGFRCEKITCPPNYISDTSHRNRCKKEKLCREDDAHCIKQPLTYSYNFLPLVSNMTLRPQGQVDLFTMRGPLWSSTNVQFDLELESVKAFSGVPPADRSFFLLNRTAFNQVVLTLIKSIAGPQEIFLNLNMKLYHNGYFEGSAVAKLLIFVSEYDF